ncbi:S-layer homology domain-containing protein [Aedoeadaptatus pacaensis]|uniref:S-layer homology domain-containing protein n=1 Tax=Aedoeadaptatus pacaensis TaxID=1776390 RepID=UPI000838F435|nr:S-layer homology domain-containing protein [Peptoniphilus pacaensis]
MKRTLALLMALLLFLTSTAPTAKVFAQGEMPETGGKARFKTILETPNPDITGGKEGTLPANGGAIKFRYDSVNVKPDAMECAVVKDDKPLTDFKFDLIVAHDGQNMNGVEYSGHLPENKTPKDVVYKFYIKEKADTKYDEKNVITITVKAKNTAEPKITGIKASEFVVAPDADSRYVSVTLTGDNLSKDSVKAVTKKDGVDTDEINWNFIPFKGLMASAEMPAAPEDKDIVYTTTFSTANGSSRTVKITVKAKSGAASTEKTLTGITIDPKSLPKTGGDVEITLQGENLEPTDITPSIYLIGEGPKEFPITWTEVSGGLKGTLTIPKNTSGVEQKYLIKFILNNGTSKPVKENIVVTTKEGPVAPAVPTVKGLIADPTSLPTAGGNVALNVIAENAKAGDIQWTVKKDGTPVPDLTPVAKDDRNFTLALPKNDMDNDITYTVEAKAEKDTQAQKATITVAKKEATPPVTPTSEIIMMAEVNEQIDAAASEKTFNVIATPPTDANNVKLHITANGKDVTLPYTVTGDKARKSVTINFPENKKTSPVVYKVTFNATGNDTVFQDDPVATFTQAAGEAVNASISSISATNDQLPLAGGDTTVTIKGTDLDKAELVTKLFKVENGTETEVTLGNYMKGSFIGRDTVKSASFTFPEVNKDTKFVFKASVDGTNFVEKAIYQTSEGSNRETESLVPKKVFTISDHSLVVDFHEPVEEARANAIIKNVHILAGSDTINLSADDKVTFDGNTLRIDFKDPIFKDKKTYKLVVDARAFKLKSDTENKAFEQTITRDTPYIEDAEFEQGYKLESEGGKVVLKLKGYNLPEDLKVKILENNKEKTDLKVTPEITGSPNERTITFTAPANTTDRVQSYSVLVSTDGVQYSSEVSNMQNRFRRMVVSVLPKDAEADAPQIDFMQIQSYGNADDGDITHTNLPTGQESKKTLVWIYGANLNADHTRLRLIDKNGVYWSPIYDATQDSGTRILMTMLDGIHGGTPGMTGKGNNMLMEVILPRGYQPDKWPGYEEGTTFKYEVAPDGVNFDSEVTVTATVRFDHEDSKKNIDKELTEVIVRHVDKDGNNIIKPETVKAYNHLHPCDLQKLLPLRDKDGFRKDFEGYKVPDTDEIVKGKTGPNHYGPAYYDGKTVEQLKNKKGEIVLVYGKAEKPVDPSTPSDPSNPSNPSNPSTPSKPDSPSNTGSGSGYFILPSTPTKEVAKPEEKPAPTKGYIAGYPDHTFRPAKSMNRAEAAAILARLCKLTGGDSTKPDFKDADGWYNAAINDVVKAGYMKGYPDGSFKPDQPITRAEFAVILSHVLKDETTPSPFKDTAGHWAKDAIDKAYAQGIIKGYGDNTFRPDALVSRAEAVAMANRTFRLQKTVVENPFTDITSDHWAYNDILTAVSNK